MELLLAVHRYRADTEPAGPPEWSQQAPAATVGASSESDDSINRPWRLELLESGDVQAAEQLLSWQISGRPQVHLYSQYFAVARVVATVVVEVVVVVW